MGLGLKWIHGVAIGFVAAFEMVVRPCWRRNPSSPNRLGAAVAEWIGVSPQPRPPYSHQAPTAVPSLGGDKLATPSPIPPFTGAHATVVSSPYNCGVLSEPPINPQVRGGGKHPPVPSVSDKFEYPISPSRSAHSPRKGYMQGVTLHGQGGTGQKMVGGNQMRAFRHPHYLPQDTPAEHPLPLNATTQRPASIHPDGHTLCPILLEIPPKTPCWPSQSLKVEAELVKRM